MSKKITLLLVFIGMIGLQSCTVNEIEPAPVDNDTISEVFELRNINFGYTGGNNYEIYQRLNPTIYSSDVILIYRKSGTTSNNSNVWQSIPRTLYLPQGELDYDFDFSREDFTIYAGGTYDLTFTPSYITNQTFRIVIVPGYFSKGSSSIDFSDYNAVIKAYNIDDSKVTVLK
ncbi:hypothetical protein [Flavobacterium sp.]|jgi:hypothetical protein|uniref:hypothetical protein n=1 Tax=Flavobacterium sp. TaxID=239 RepID=UPI0037BED51C